MGTRLAASLLLFAVPAAAKFYEASHYDVQLQLDRSGSLTVTETIDFRFVAGPFHFAFRKISPYETDGISDIHASMDGQDCPPGTDPGEVEIRGTSPVTVRWHFSEIMSGNHKFTVQYHVAGVVQPGKHSQVLVWRALPSDDQYGIRSTEITVGYPPGVRPRNIGIRSSMVTFEEQNGRSILMMSNPEKDVVVQATFPAGSFDCGTPAWMSARERAQRDHSNGIRWGTGVAAVILVAATLWLFQTRKATPSSPPALPVRSPPSMLPPAIGTSFARNAGGSLGTLFDLARRGILRIEESERSVWTGRHFNVVLSGPPGRLAPHELIFLELGFKDGAKSAPLKDFLPRVARGGRFSRAVRQELRDAGWIEPERESARFRLTAAGLSGFLGGLALLAIGVAGRFALAIPISIALIVVGVLGLTLGTLQPVWTDAGIVVSSQWKAFARYVRQLALSREPLPDASAFERILPYAAGFGLASSLLVRRKKEGGVELPPWFHAIQSADASDAFVAFVSSGDASSSDGGGGGGGDASGGGSSGAG